jgi:hypothetical protein
MKSKAAVKRAIDDLDLKDILAKVRKERHWTAADAREADKWYRCFLWVSYLHGRRSLIAINPLSDHLWHGHILHTRRYRADSQRIFGRYLDHNPIIGRLTKERREELDRSEDWYELECGNLPRPFIHWCY